jgi:hypothetical protein
MPHLRSGSSSDGRDGRHKRRRRIVRINLHLVRIAIHYGQDGPPGEVEDFDDIGASVDGNMVAWHLDSTSG